MCFLTCLDEEREDFHDGLSKPILSDQNKGVCSGAQWSSVEFKETVAGDSWESGDLTEGGDRPAAVVGGSEDAPVIRAH